MYPPNLVSFRKVFVKIKILFRIRIMILLWISIPNLIPPKFIVSTAKVHVRTARHPDRQTEFCLLVLCTKTYKT